MKQILLILLVALAGCESRGIPKPETSPAVYDLGFVFSHHLEIEQDIEPFSFTSVTESDVKEYINKLPVSSLALREGQAPNPRFEGTITYAQYKFGYVTMTFRFGEKDWDDQLICIQVFSQPETSLVLIGLPDEKTQTQKELEDALGAPDFARNYFFRDQDGNRRELQDREYIWERSWAQIAYYQKPGPVDIVEYWNPRFIEERKNSDTHTGVSK